jgi:hypothetical protein
MPGIIGQQPWKKQPDRHDGENCRRRSHPDQDFCRIPIKFLAIIIQLGGYQAPVAETAAFVSRAWWTSVKIADFRVFCHFSNDLFLIQVQSFLRGVLVTFE